MTVLAAILFAQIVGLAVQVKRPTDPQRPDSEPTRLIRIWANSVVTPFEELLVNSSHWTRDTWHDYLYLRGLRKQNADLQAELDRMRIQQARLSEDAAQAHRLQALLQFKEQFISQTIAAQVIGTSGSELSRVLTIDKGANDGLKPDMAVTTPDGVVGKVLQVFRHSATVLEIGDQSSGVGAILEKSRLQGIVKGSASGEISLLYVMSDEKVEPGERVLTSGGDRIFPKGLPIGTVTGISPGRDLFLNIRVKPSAELARVEEVLVITKIVEKEPTGADAQGPVRAADILAQRLPTVEKKAPAPTPTPGAKPNVAGMERGSATRAPGSETRAPSTTPPPKPNAMPTPSSTPPAPTPSTQGAPQ